MNNFSFNYILLRTPVSLVFQAIPELPRGRKIERLDIEHFYKLHFTWSKCNQTENIRTTYDDQNH